MLAAFCSALCQDDPTLLQYCWGLGSGEDSSLHKTCSHWLSVQHLCHLAYLSLLFPVSLPWEGVLDSHPSMETISDEASLERARCISQFLCQVFVGFFYLSSGHHFRILFACCRYLIRPATSSIVLPLSSFRISFLGNTAQVLRYAKFWANS